MRPATPLLATPLKARRSGRGWCGTCLEEAPAHAGTGATRGAQRNRLVNRRAAGDNEANKLMRPLENAGGQWRGVAPPDDERGSRRWV
ncbi:hypothetical protein NDU88_002662 [Pleurodeles waltl]|uniref:Uncharacterized protein n=1 Tax=Pleurodeles waltl TaxID=8319 RepID=A0AAV7TNW8_PLEWA|nr:hypothetical protein NDU88_002662 [Pleurodeles waltl]